MVILTELGITMGFHRMLVHQSFIAHPIVKFILLMLGSMALQGPASNWASVHLKHHAHTDDDDDPHSPTVKGWLHSHCGWIFTMAHDEHISARQTFGKNFNKTKWFSFLMLLFCLVYDWIIYPIFNWWIKWIIMGRICSSFLSIKFYMEC